MKVGRVDEGLGGVQVTEPAGYECARDEELGHQPVLLGTPPAPPCDLGGVGDHRRAAGELDEPVAQPVGDLFHLRAAARVEPGVIRGYRPAVGANTEDTRHLTGHSNPGDIAGVARAGSTGRYRSRRRPVEVLRFLLDLVGGAPVERQLNGGLGQTGTAELEQGRPGALGAHVNAYEKGLAHERKPSPVTETRSKRDTLPAGLDRSTSNALRSPRWKAMKYSRGRCPVV